MQKFIFLGFFVSLFFVCVHANEGETTLSEKGSSVTASLQRRKKDIETVATVLPGSTVHDFRKKRSTEVPTPVTESPVFPVRRRRNDETTTFASVVEENAEAVAHGDDVNEATKKKRHIEEGTVSAPEEAVIETDTEESGTEHIEGEDLTKVPESGPISRMKRVSRAGSSHRNRPSAVERLSSNSNSNINDPEETGNPDDEFDFYNHY